MSSLETSINSFWRKAQALQALGQAILAEYDPAVSTGDTIQRLTEFLSLEDDPAFPQSLGAVTANLRTALGGAGTVFDRTGANLAQLNDVLAAAIAPTLPTQTGAGQAQSAIFLALDRGSTGFDGQLPAFRAGVANAQAPAYVGNAITDDLADLTAFIVSNKLP